MLSKNKKTIITLLGIILIFIYIYNFYISGSLIRQPRKEKEQPAQPAPVYTAVPNTAETSDNMKIKFEGSNSRNVFLPPGYKAPSARKAPKPAEKPFPYRLTGLIPHGETPTAILTNTKTKQTLILKSGDAINDAATVINIGKNSITINNNGKKITLNLN